MEEKPIEVLEQELKEFEAMVEEYYRSKEFIDYISQLGEDIEI